MHIFTSQIKKVNNMSEKVKLYSVKYPKDYAGQTIEFPVLGVAAFNADGTLDVPGDKFDLDKFLELTRVSFDFAFYGAETYADVVSSNEETASNAVVNEKNGRGRQPFTEAEKEKKAQLDQLTQEELLLLAKDAGIGTVEEIAAMSNTKIKNKLVKKLVN